VTRAVDFAPHLILVSQVMFGSGTVVSELGALADLVGTDGPLVAVDGYHGFMAIDTDWAVHADRLFYMAGGYKYAMAGEGVAFIHAPAGLAPRPAVTGWYAEFDDLALPPGVVGYAPDARRLLGATFDPSGLYRFVAVRDMLESEGLDTSAISAHAGALRDRFLHGMGDTPLATAQLLNPPQDGPPQARFLALRTPAAARWQAALLDRDIVTDVRGDVLRIGFGLYQTARDVDRLLDELTYLNATG
jgi:selenocysteine lyase/cysteine desulfurase